MNPCSARVIVLGISAYSEADKLVTLYSRESGRIHALAKGAWKSQKRFVNKLELFSHLHIFYRPPRNGSGLALLGEAELLAAHLRLRQSYTAYVTASYLCELTLRFTREHDPDPQVYRLLRWAFASLDQGRKPLQVALFFHIRFLELIGYRPELHQCERCRAPVHPELSFTFFPARGSLLCNRCLDRDAMPRDSHLSLRTLKCLAHVQSIGPERIHCLRIPEQAGDEAMAALHQYSVYLLQQDLHSWPLVQSLHGPDAPGWASKRDNIQRYGENPP